MSTKKKQGDKRTYADRREYLIQAVAKRRRKMRGLALEYGGGECQICGYKKCAWALTFHHLDPKGKNFGLSANGITRSWEKTKKELDKCILLYMNYHAEVHHGATKIPKK